MKIAGTFFKKITARKWTWISPKRETINEIELILTNKLSAVKGILVILSIEFASDHRLCRGTISIPKRAKYKLYIKINTTASFVIPVYKLEDAKKKLEGKSKIVNEKKK